ncbi:MAG TPA: prolyl oligopeptidase family serine peptidase [Candidatus Sulfotelmatobacter sp.]|nr:prolyl oligopeptidase family serine peptidase [Candidatus Sulfotelmatobacter sp.]
MTSRRIILRAERKAKPAESAEGQVIIVDLSTGSRDALRFPGKIEEYTASADGGTIAFAVQASVTELSNTQSGHRIFREWIGYPILFGQGDDGAIEQLPRYEIYLAHRLASGTFSLRQLVFTELSSQLKVRTLRSVLRLNLSPDAKYLLINYSADRLPPGWQDQPFIRYVAGFGTFTETYALGLCEVRTGRLRLGFNFPAGLIHTSWSEDSRAYSVVGPSPFGTNEGSAETNAATEAGDMLTFMNRFQHVFAVDVESGAVSKVLQREGGEPGNIKFWKDLPLFWKRSAGPMLVRAGDNSLVWVTKVQGSWRETKRFDVLQGEKSISSLTSDGSFLVGVSQTRMIPPDLFVFDLSKKQVGILTDLNPEYREISLGQIEEISWSNRYGSDCKGILILPVGYTPGRAYPMVFMGTDTSDEFFSDVPYASTAFAPQSLAAAGFVMVIAQYPLNDKTPEGQFPGEMSEAYNWMGMVESAIDLLVSRGIADKKNVGLVGFSRTSWLTDFALTHSSYRFIAASSADSGIYTYGAYFRYNSQAQIKSAETQVGGAPYGECFRYWQGYAPPFNAKRVNAAVLMEYTGTAEDGFEFFTALNRWGKAVELYRYPKGDHPLDTPLERLASLQRNLDWFRFWMQGYESHPPDYDPTQYVRWRALRLRNETVELQSHLRPDATVSCEGDATKSSPQAMRHCSIK